MHWARTYQRLVNTTPKPRATKNSKGDELEPPDWFDESELDGGLTLDGASLGREVDAVERAAGDVLATISRARSPTPSCTAAICSAIIVTNRAGPGRAIVDWRAKPVKHRD